MSLNDFLDLEYKPKILKLDKMDGGGYEAVIPEFGQATVVGSGDTIEEALAALDEMRVFTITQWYNLGRAIPLPMGGE
jgi:predicted RNase H-like HicB family nuclease